MLEGEDKLHGTPVHAALAGAETHKPIVDHLVRHPGCVTGEQSHARNGGAINLSTQHLLLPKAKCVGTNMQVNSIRPEVRAS